jgi:hypothetical protein
MVKLGARKPPLTLSPASLVKIPNCMKQKRLNKFVQLSLGILIAAVFGQSALAQQVLFTENFETPDSGNSWTVNAATARDSAEFGFDYSSVGIPAAPGTTTTRGLKLQANRPIEAGALSGVSVSPNSQVFPGNYVLEFDWWLNFPGPAPGGTNGSTQLTAAGILTSGTVPHYAGAGDGLWFAATSEGGSSSDYRAYFRGSNQTTPTSLYPAGGQNHTATYYQTNFPGGVSAPAEQTALFPDTQIGTTGAGTIGWQWRHVKITKEGSLVKWDVDGVRLANIDLDAAGVTFGGENILFAQSDINNGQTDLPFDPLLFGLIDNVKVTSIPGTPVTAILQDPAGVIVDTISEADTATIAAFKVTRPTEDVAAALNVNFTLTGTATRGDATTGDYFIRTNGVVMPTGTTVTIPAGSADVTVEIVGNNDNVAELDETIIFEIATGAGYLAISPKGGTVTIRDDETPTVDISSVVFSQMFEGNEHDRIRVRLQRRGDINAGPFDVNLAYAGTATTGADFTPQTTVTFNPGDVTLDVDIQPLNDATVEERETVIISVATGTGYTVGTNNVLTAGATGVIRDDDVPAETILFRDNITPESAANWQIRFGSVIESEDYSVFFDRDYADPAGMHLPPAPHASGETFGLLMSVNKLDGVNAAAGLNAYAIGQDFTGNYALRFDMYIMQNSGTGTTENPIFGVNHDGSHTNWYSNATNNVPSTSEYDGVWAAVAADGALLPGDPRARAYQLFTAPGVTLGGLFGPTLAAGREASELAPVFHNPPWTSGSAGAPGNDSLTQTPSWAQVELRHENGVVTLSINNTNILTHANTTTSTHGTVMLGYNDAYNSGPATPDAIRGGFVIYDNVRVVRLGGGTAAEVRVLTSTLSRTGNTVQFDFTAGAGEPTTAFKVYSATSVTGPYTEDGTATITAQAGSTYRATATATDTMRFYQIRRTTP